MDWQRFLESDYMTRQRSNRNPIELELDPIRSELVSLDRLEEYARALAQGHVIGAATQDARLLERLDINERLLTDAYRTIAEEVREGRTISPAAEWLMDNFHLVQEQLREIREDLPETYYRDLPKLCQGRREGYPRVYELAEAIVQHSDSRLDAEALRRFTAAYQSCAPIGIGELWAIAIMLRLALVDNLRRLASRTLWERDERGRAERWAAQLLETADRRPSEIFMMLADREQSKEPISTPFAAHILQRLRDTGPGVAPALLWLEQRFAAQGTSGDEMVHAEHHRQAADQVSVGNVITSMRLLSAIDWAEFVERTSVVEALLRRDPTGTYPRMDFQTRNDYRGVIELIAKRAGVAETDVARRALDRAQRSWADDPLDERRGHVGYSIVGGARQELEAEFTGRLGRRDLLHQRNALRHPSAVYFWTLGLLTLIPIVLLTIYARGEGAEPLELIILVALLAIPASDLAVSSTNRDITRMMPPQVLPKLDFQDGVPANCRTMVVIPTMLTSADSIATLLARLEIHALANPDRQLYFALLSDLADAPCEVMPDDEMLIERAVSGIDDLNERHREPGADGDRFLLFHRSRRMNPSEGCWMGWERKRGKITEFNRLLRGATTTSYSTFAGEATDLAAVRYVITLDSDTELPRGTATRLIGAIAHPLNVAHFDARIGRVTEGYGIMQPRVAVTLRGANRSRFTRIFSGATGLDPYTTAVSDVYQDLFGEGNYVGKGIYDIDAFEHALDGRIPENSVLSHDLLEGLYARAALLTDVEVFDDYPSRYDTYAARQHRWVRGDWQLLRWLRSDLPLISRWKLFDNLRRSLVAPGAVALLSAAWTVLPGSPLVWTLFVLLTLAFPIYGHVVNSLLVNQRGVPWTSHARNVGGDSIATTLQVALTIAFLPHQAYLMVDAIVRTLTRMWITKRRRLEWVTAAQLEQRMHRRPRRIWVQMWSAPMVALAVGALVAALQPDRLVVAGPFLAAWMLAPFIADGISRTRRPKIIELSPQDRHDLRLMARRTWRYFDTFVAEHDNFLPPDNVQEDPREMIAHRTSPTNIGLGLLGTLAAYDFGYVNQVGLIESLERSLATLARLERYCGHFYNWYDTVTLQPLTPAYISTVDSGNLSGHLLTLKQGCIEVAAQPIATASMLTGISDALGVLQQELDKYRWQAPSLESSITALNAALTATPTSLIDWMETLDLAAEAADALAAEVAAVVDRTHGTDVTDGADLQELNAWAAAVLDAADCHRAALERAVPWVRLLQLHGRSSQPGGNDLLELDRWVRAQPIPSLQRLSELDSALIDELDSLSITDVEHDELRQGALASARFAADATRRLLAIADQAESYSAEMDFDFLYDESRHLFSIGYRIDDNRRDDSYFDLLASEARLGSFMAIARGQVPQEHWFRLGRALTSTRGGKALLSWTATMFEYLMPLLVMRTYENTLLAETYQSVVARQIDYGRHHSVPWGISESAYNARDLAQNYQYRAFGVPGLGLKRGLADDLVVSPYASVLALAVAPHKALHNLRRLDSEGLTSRFGFYEAVDYTPSRLPPGHSREVIRTYMAHHQGMSLIAFDNLLNGSAMPRRFHADPLVRATELLLQERVPRDVPLAHPHAEEVSEGRTVRQTPAPFTRQFSTADTPVPQAHLLSNGNYTVMVTNAGGGFSRWRDLAVTRWREDVTCDDWGSFCYVRDLRSNALWSAGFQPTLAQPSTYLATFSADKVEFLRRDDDIETHTEITISPEDDAEIRRLTLTNRSAHAREIEVTSCSEIVIATPNADVAHLAFSKLFVQSEWLPEHSALLFHRRARSAEEASPSVVHVSAVHGEGWGRAEYETDRVRFIGRGRSAASPIAFGDRQPLSGAVGAVLDPIACIRRRVRIEPGQSARLSYITAIAATREAVLDLADKYRDPRAVTRAFALAWTQSRVELRHLEISSEEAHLFQELGSRALYSDSLVRADLDVIARNNKHQSGLWAYGISGDLPIIVVRVADTLEVDLVRQILRAHEYWRLNGLALDLVILNEHASSYAQGFQDFLLNLLRTTAAQPFVDRPGGVFLRRCDLMSEEDRTLLLTVARVVLCGHRGTLAQQLHRRRPELITPAPLRPAAAIRPAAARPVAAGRDPGNVEDGLVFANGLGGFSSDGREYVIELQGDAVTPMPWANVVANPGFGFMVTELGGGFTWSQNSRENRLTPWSNDPVADRLGEAVFVRDEATADVWSIAPHPIRRGGRYVIRHGAGYTTFEHDEPGLAQELTMFVPVDDPVKILRLRVSNRSDERRRLSATAYFDLVLGVNRETSAPHVITWVDGPSGAILARNAYNNEFADGVVFAATSEAVHSLTTSRIEFIGRNRPLSRPEALGRSRLSGRVGVGLDPCAAYQVPFDLRPGETREITFVLGEGSDVDHARTLVQRYQSAEAVASAFEHVGEQWDDLLGTVQVSTPEPAMDLMINRWLLYQTVACRLWGRSAMYQSGGAFGFRDQLQDVLALLHAAPKLAREHILLAAERQFVEGDVQHWWHPPTGRGVRTRFSDDLHWLALVTTVYVDATGDVGILDEPVGYLQGRPLDAHEDDYYATPEVAAVTGSLYEHCVRALDRGLALGPHGLPLIGSGDWNDGMNRVGHKGSGESVWMAWFLHLALQRFAVLAESRGDVSRVGAYHAHLDLLKKSLEGAAWDGEWYRRAYFDDGTPLGSADNDECRIDSIAQSWSVIAGAGCPQRARQALDSAERLLVDEQHRLLLLFSPPFDNTHLDPGYIKGYVPGVRENGGQYTHAAVWSVLARAMLGDGDRAHELFSMINPITHSSSAAEVAVYQVEPYVVAADVYGIAPHIGRGGWTWYTGSAGWMYQVGLQALLGLSVKGDRLTVEPCIPPHWDGFEIRYRHGSAVVEIMVENPQHVQRGVCLVEVDGVPSPDRIVILDGARELTTVRVVMGG